MKLLGLNIDHCGQSPALSVSTSMRWAWIAAIIVAGAAQPAAATAASGQSTARPPLHNPVLLNVGMVCRWNARCMDRQEGAMKRALKYVRKKDPPTWRIQLCNRNARRGSQRVDWVGFDRCIRNKALRPPPQSYRRGRRS